jgi:hypothetical protein
MEITRRYIKAALLIGLAVLALTACKKDSSNANSVYLPVVEGYLVPGHTLSIKLYQQKSLDDTSKYGLPLTGLKVYISDGSQNMPLTESPSGTYTHSDQNFLVAGKTYTLQFNYLTSSVSAQTVMPARPANFATQYTGITISAPSTTITANTILDKLSWDNPDSLNHVLVFNNPDGNAFPVNSFNNNRPVNFQINTNNTSFYNITENIFPYYGHYKIILLRVNKEYTDLIKSNTSNSTSQNLANIPTNVINGYGIFTAMQADTLSFDVL